MATERRVFLVGSEFIMRCGGCGEFETCRESVGLLDDLDALVVEYGCDTWGKRVAVAGLLATTLGERNSFCYRGYVYDEEIWAC